LSPASIASSIMKLIADLSPDLLESMEAGSWSGSTTRI
jgi:hypothetical protein